MARQSSDFVVSRILRELSSCQLFTVTVSKSMKTIYRSIEDPQVLVELREASSTREKCSRLKTGCLPATVKYSEKVYILSCNTARFFNERGWLKLLFFCVCWFLISMFRVCILTCFQLSFFSRLGDASLMGACKY